VSRLLVAEARDALTLAASQWLAAAITACVQRKGGCSIALSGGSTPRPIYRCLAQDASVVWSRVHVYFGDERCVGPDDPGSNYRLARESLLDAVRPPPAQVHRIHAEIADHKAAADEYAAALPAAFDILVLGIGIDAHTASLFPGSAAVRERTRRVVPSRGPEPPHDRITITPPVIEAASALLMVASGADKATAVARALTPSADPILAPACLAQRGVWMMDRLAASRI
jgi:6-phosphogluconolactonase